MTHSRSDFLSYKILLISSLFSSAHFTHAGVISDAPPLAELFLNGLQMILVGISIIAVIAFIFTGIMYISASGDPQRMEQSKKMLIGSVVGLVIALMALIIVRVLTNIV